MWYIDFIRFHSNGVNAGVPVTLMKVLFGSACCSGDSHSLVDVYTVYVTVPAVYLQCDSINFSRRSESGSRIPDQDQFSNITGKSGNFSGFL